jgi:cellulose biosynthesis protein BcsQ
MGLNLLSLYDVTNISDTIHTLQKRINLMTIVTAFCSSGTGKTTLLIHLAYYCALQGIETALIELDNRNSFHTCCGLTESEFDTSSIFSPDFTGNYSLLPLWKRSYLINILGWFAL